MCVCGVCVYVCVCVCFGWTVNGMLQVNIVPINVLPTTDYSKQNRETGGKEKGWRALCEKKREDVPSENHLNFTILFNTQTELHT